MEYTIFLFLYCLFILVALVIQGTVLNLLTSKLGFNGAGVRKTTKVLALVVLVGAINVVFALLASGHSNSTLVSFVMMIVSAGAIMAVFHFQYRERFLRIALVVAVFIILGSGLKTIAQATFVQAFRTPTGSMSPGLEVNDYFLVSKYAYQGADPVRGDILAFEFPRDRNIEYVKRVMGLPGETIEIRSRVVLIDGHAVDDPWGGYPKAGPPGGINPRMENFGPFLIPAGEFFLLGDNRGNSVDSRYFGSVPSGLLIGKAMLRYWPPSRLGRISS